MNDIEARRIATHEREFMQDGIYHARECYRFSFLKNISGKEAKGSEQAKAANDYGRG